LASPPKQTIDQSTLEVVVFDDFFDLNFEIIPGGGNGFRFGL
jgi:hypothetical protein